MKVSVCVGEYAKSPYIFKGLGIKVFCMEELCYALKENAFLLDGDLMSDTLLEWIGKECRLPELAKELYARVRRKEPLSSFVSIIMEYVGFYGLMDIRQVESTLKKGMGMNAFEKQKARADHLVFNKKYATALMEYQQLLQKWESGVSTELKSKILHNKGVVLAKLMLYREAARCFCDAFDIDKSQESYLAYLAAKRMELEEEDYIDFVAGLVDSLEISLEVERAIEQLNKEWQEGEDSVILKQRLLWKEYGDKQKYYEENERLAQALKNGYRNCAGE